ncbi:MAG: Gfo/Idh/MocA family oxidoreductase [Bacteroidales bacterium]|nr:Gfo/Idh/MocA family oxidoreductase [Bacteroidales bacterium]
MRIAALGIGNRAGKYLSCLPPEAEVAYLVEPDVLRLSQAARRYGVPAEHCFSTPDAFFAARPSVDGIILTVPDRLHYHLCRQALSLGCPVLLEKPVAPTLAEYEDLVRLDVGRKVGVCMVMRYHPYFRRIRDIVASGEIGAVQSIDHVESIGPDRMGHTFVRGLWSRRADTGPIFLSKCCHDADFLLWMTGGRAQEVVSQGARTKFKVSEAPAGATVRCLDCPVSCPYSAVDLYRERRAWIDGFGVPEGETVEAVIEEELRTGRYGRCVYRCDNDVNDTQEVHIHLDNGIQLTMRLDGISLEEGRKMVIRGTEGTLTAAGTLIEVGGRREDFSALAAQPLHAGADRLLVEDFVAAIRTGRPMAVTLADAFEAHRICYLAD